MHDGNSVENVEIVCDYYIVLSVGLLHVSSVSYGGCFIVLLK